MVYVGAMMETLAQPAGTAQGAPPLELAERLVERALRAGADAADATASRTLALAVHWRGGALEELEGEEAVAMGLRVFAGKRLATVSSSQAGAADELVERALAMARQAPEDPFAGLASPQQLATAIPDLDLDGGGPPATGTLLAMAREAEEAARAVAGVTNSEGAQASWSGGERALAASNGFRGSYAASSATIAASAIAGAGLAMEQDGEYRRARHLGDLPGAAEIGAEAGRRAVRRLGAAAMATGSVPVVFDNRCAASLLGHLVAAIGGDAIARGTSFLKDSMGERLFAPGIAVAEDPHRRRGLRSRPFDGEGLATKRRRLIDDGRLTCWLLDCRSARQLGLEATGHATRGGGAAPSNLWLEPGAASLDELIADIEEGLFVTHLTGLGVNGINGDYSRGAGGFRIRKGALDHAVNEATIAGNLKDMYAHLTPADDLELLTGMDAPSLRIDGMTVAGG